jgi:uncharacterized repeat protein (TIGR02543 family)
MKKHLFKSIITAFIAIIILLVLTFTLPCIPSQAAVSDPICWGVFVGVSEYMTNPDVVYADDDALAFYAALSPVWGTSHTRALIDSVATEAEILNSISWLAANARAQDTVMFTFSGMGVAPGAICPSDYDVVSLGLTTTELANAFAAVQARKILIILDCNYAGKFRSSLSQEGRVLMLSCGGGEKSVESPAYQHGVFTYFILEALNHFDTYDANGDYELSAEEIAPYANAMTTNVNGLQHPILDDRLYGELPLLAKFDFALNNDFPAGTIILTLDGIYYLSPPDTQIWVPGSTHTMTVPEIVNVSNDTRYIFTRWNDGIALLDRTISKGSYSTNYRLQYLLTVTSPYGETAGSGWYTSGANANFSVTSAIETADTRRYFTSWSGDFTGTSASGSLLMNGPKTLTANWRTEYLLTINSEYYMPSGAGWYDAGETVYISIDPEHGFLTRQIFDGWSGDITGTAASISITMDSPKTITANWHTDTLQLYILTASIISVVVLIGSITAIIILLRRKKATPPPTAAASPTEIPPPPPATPRSTAAITRRRKKKPTKKG